MEEKLPRSAGVQLLSINTFEGAFTCEPRRPMLRNGYAVDFMYGGTPAYEGSLDTFSIRFPLPRLFRYSPERRDVSNLQLPK